VELRQTIRSGLSFDLTPRTPSTVSAPRSSTGPIRGCPACGSRRISSRRSDRPLSDRSRPSASSRRRYRRCGGQAADRSSEEIRSRRESTKRRPRATSTLRSPGAWISSGRSVSQSLSTPSAVGFGRRRRRIVNRFGELPSPVHQLIRPISARTVAETHSVPVRPHG
jgi:hypothetical protein